MKTSKFKLHNQNPRQLKRTSDCAFRAISFALGITWEDALKELTEVALKVKDPPNSKKVIEKYLKLKGFEKQKQPRQIENTKYTVNEFCDFKPQGTYLVTVAGHITVVKDGHIYDTWDCGYKSVGNY